MVDAENATMCFGQYLTEIIHCVSSVYSESLSWISRDWRYFIYVARASDARGGAALLLVIFLSFIEIGASAKTCHWYTLKSINTVLCTCSKYLGSD